MLTVKFRCNKCYSNAQATGTLNLKSPQSLSCLCFKDNILWPYCSNLTWPFTIYTVKPHFCQNFSFSTLVNEGYIHLPQSPTVPVNSDKSEQLFRSARAAMFPDDTKQSGTKGPPRQRVPSCHPAQNAVKTDEPQQLHRAGYGSSNHHRIAYLPLNVLSSHCHYHV